MKDIDKLSLTGGGGFVDVQTTGVVGGGGWGGGGGSVKVSKSNAQHPNLVDVKTHCRASPTDPWVTDVTWVAHE